MAVRRPSQTPMPSFCRRFTSSVLILGLGSAFGALIAYLSFSPRIISPKNPLIMPKSVEHATRATFHDPPPSRPGKSIKKDMSVQFREYIPKKIFLNVGGTMPLSVELFLDTYPHAEHYDIYSFLADSSYDIYYAAYDNHTVISPVMVTGLDHNDTESLLRSKGSKPIHYLDLALWIKHNTKQDDYVLVKMENEGEYDILDRFVSLAAIEWIDKYYTVKWNESIISEYENILSAFSVKIYSWDEENGTYSDFDEVNPTHVPPVGAGLKSTCLSSENPFNFALFLFTTHISDQALKTLKIVKAIGPKRLPVGLFIPLDFLVYQTDFAADLFTSFQGGIFLDESNTTSHTTYYSLRNSIVKGSHKFQRFPSHTVLQYIMMWNVKNEDVLNRISKERHVTIFNITEVLDERTLLHSLSATTKHMSDTGLVGLDISAQNSHHVPIRIARKHSKSLTDIAECRVGIPSLRN